VYLHLHFPVRRKLSLNCIGRRFLTLLPERPGALRKFLLLLHAGQTGQGFNISLFHVRLVIPSFLLRSKHRLK
jgi:hypothetical protein